MESKSTRIEFRLEPTLKARTKSYCARTNQSMNKYLGDLIMRDLIDRGTLTPDDIRLMRD